MLDFLEQKIQKQKILNLETLLSKENEIPFQNESVDLLLLVNTLHEFRGKEKLVNEIWSARAPAVMVDFKKEETGFGPPMSI